MLRIADLEQYMFSAKNMEASFFLKKEEKIVLLPEKNDFVNTFSHPEVFLRNTFFISVHPVVFLTNIDLISGHVDDFLIKTFGIYVTSQSRSIGRQLNLAWCSVRLSLQ